MDIKWKFLIIGLKMETLLKLKDKMSNTMFIFMEKLKLWMRKLFGFLEKLLWLRLMITLFQDMAQ
jgi:hypothetical protein